MYLAQCAALLNANACSDAELNAYENGQTANSKIERLKQAVKTFSDQFTPNRDKVGIIAFNTGAKTVRGVTKFNTSADTSSPDQLVTCPGSSCDWSDLYQAIDSLSPTANTNPSAALWASWEAMSSAGVTDVEEASYILFTDGAPTAGRFKLKDSNGDIKDYMHYSVEWRTYDSNNNLADVDIRPSQFAVRVADGVDTVMHPVDPTADLLFNHTYYYTLWKDQNDNEISFAANCSLRDYPLNITSGYGNIDYQCLSDVPETQDPNDVQDCVERSLNDCLNASEQMRYYMPDNTRTALMSSDSLDWSSYKWKEHYYNVAISLSDFLREHRGNVFAIGLGSPSSLYSSTTTPPDYEPFQNVDDDMTRKDRFLTRLALD